MGQLRFAFWRSHSITPQKSGAANPKHRQRALQESRSLLCLAFSALNHPLSPLYPIPMGFGIPEGSPLLQQMPGAAQLAPSPPQGFLPASQGVGKKFSSRHRSVSGVPR